MLDWRGGSANCTGQSAPTLPRDHLSQPAGSRGGKIRRTTSGSYSANTPKFTHLNIYHDKASQGLVVVIAMLMMVAMGDRFGLFIQTLNNA